jgi:hypothetical protein
MCAEEREKKKEKANREARARDPWGLLARVRERRRLGEEEKKQPKKKKQPR